MFNHRLTHTKDSKIVLDVSLLNTQHYKVRIKSKWINPGKGVTLSLHLDEEGIKKGAFGWLSTAVGQFTYIE